MKRSYNSCPNCGYKFRWIERVRCAPLIFRAIVKCPLCATPVSWSKGPYRIMMGAALALLPLTAFAMFLSNRVPKDSEDLICAPLVLIPVMIAVIACIMMKLEISNSANQVPEDTARKIADPQH